MNTDYYITPEWPAPPGVKALQTTRQHPKGSSQSAYSQFNLGLHTGEDVDRVAKNRELLEQVLPTPPAWLKQVHGNKVVQWQKSQQTPEADACWSQKEKQVCAVMTADCLPVLLCDRYASVVAAIHAGWRGLYAGVIAATVNALPVEAGQLMAWLGPAIGIRNYQVDEPFYHRFVELDSTTAEAFERIDNHWHANLYMLARLQLRALGVTEIYGGDFCTYAEGQRFYSYRRDQQLSGRQASLIWLE